MGKIKKRKSNNFRLIVLLSMAAFIVTATAIMTGGYVKSGYDIEVGKVSPARFVAPRDVENKLATSRLRQEARDSVQTIYDVDQNITDGLVMKLNDFFQQAFELRKEYKAFFNPTDDGSKDNSELINDRNRLSAYLTESQINLLLNMDTKTYNELQQNLTDILNDLLEQGIQPDRVDKSLSDAKEEIALIYNVTEMRSLAYEIISYSIEPNLVVDLEATEKRREDKAAEVEPVLFVKNQKIVDENEIITEEIYAVLEDLDYVSKDYISNFVPLSGAVLLAAVIFICALLYIHHFNYNISENRKVLLLLFTLYIMVILTTWLLIDFSYYFAPVLMFTMLISLLITPQLAVVLNLCITIITCLIYKADLSYLYYYLITGTFVGIIAKYITERNRIILVGALTGLVNILVLIGYVLFFENNYVDKLFYESLVAVLTGLFTVIICTGTLPVWEAVFGIITPMKLLNLTNPDNEVLRRLTIEAPGTYHHSLIVANLAETAAFDIGANSAIARVGGYYHDIGKLKYPQYFAENQVGENPHNFMDPYSSVQVIKSHVDYGLEMAEAHKLPPVIRDMISMHHGNTLIKYFFYKVKNENPDEEINESDFRYNHKTPNSQETAVVMLADTVEAAVRSMIPTGKTMNEVEVFVRTLIKDKLTDGQLEESGLKIKDLDTVAKSFMRVFKGMYHERIPYPKAEKKD